MKINSRVFNKDYIINSTVTFNGISYKSKEYLLYKAPQKDLKHFKFPIGLNIFCKDSIFDIYGTSHNIKLHSLGNLNIEILEESHKLIHGDCIFVYHKYIEVPDLPLDNRRHILFSVVSKISLTSKGININRMPTDDNLFIRRVTA